VDLRQASVNAAQATLEQAELNLGYATITAPVKGIVGKRSVNVGDRVTVGQALMGLTQIDKLWVTADFRETQVRRMHPGEPVTVHVDALGRDFDGDVESIAAATGSRYSVLPPENASGNYVKVVQRLPVRIRLHAGQPGLELLRPGMSVEPKVRVK
jgi:membrane fusion protein (multidrug efflux system)